MNVCDNCLTSVMREKEGAFWPAQQGARCEGAQGRCGNLASFYILTE